MLKRLTRDELLGSIAQLVARRSTCLRMNVGAVLAQDGRIVSMGYNGAPSGMTHCTPETCSMTDACTRTVHAEANVIAFAAREGIATHGAALYTTHSPCNDCAKLIINSGIHSVYYYQTYRDFKPMIMLQNIGIKVYQLKGVGS